MSNVVVTPSPPNEISVSLTPKEITFNNNPVGVTGPPGPPGADGLSYTAVEYLFPTATNPWIINHNKGYNPNVSVLDLFNREVKACVTYLNLNTIQIDFNAQFSGKAIVR